MVSNVVDKAKCAHRIYFIEPHQKMWLETNILERRRRYWEWRENSE